MEDNFEITQSDANEAQDSSAPASEDQQTQSDTSAQPAEGTSQPENVPFHEHPRFKELIEERKTYTSQLEQYKSQMEQMQRQLQSLQQPQKAPEQHEFVKALGQIDPKFGEWASAQEKAAQELAQLKEWRQQQETQSLLNQYEQGFEKLYSDSKLPASHKELVKEMLDGFAARNPSLGMKDLPQAFRTISEKFSKTLEAEKRQDRAAYVKDKTKDASVPASQPKAKASARDSKGQFLSGDRESLMAQVVKEALIKSRAGSDL